MPRPRGERARSEPRCAGQRQRVALAKVDEAQVVEPTRGRVSDQSGARQFLEPDSKELGCWRRLLVDYDGDGQIGPDPLAAAGQLVWGALGVKARHHAAGVRHGRDDADDGLEAAAYPRSQI